jgi:hypothetical protein
VSLLGFFKRKSVHNEVEMSPNTFLHVYGDDQKEADRALEIYAGKHQAETWKKDKSFRSEQYMGVKRGLEVGYRGTTVDDSRVGLPQIPAVIRVNTPDSQLIDGSGPVRASQNGQNITITINLAELGMPTSSQAAQQAKLREEFSHTMSEVMRRVAALERQLAEREREIENLRQMPQKNPQNLEKKSLGFTEKERVNLEKTEPLAKNLESRVPEKYDLSLNSPSGVVTDRLAKNLDSMRKDIEQSGVKEHQVFARNLSEHVDYLRGVVKTQEKESRQISLPLVLPDRQSTERLLQALQETKNDLAKKSFGKSVMSDEDARYVGQEILRETAGLTHVRQIQTVKDKDPNKAIEPSVSSRDKGQSSERQVLTRDDKQINQRGTLCEVIKAAQNAHGDIAFVSANWSQYAKIRVQSPDCLGRIVNKVGESLHQKSQLDTKAYVLTDQGTIRNTLTQQDEYIILTPHTAKDQQISEKLRVAAEHYFVPKETASPEKHRPNKVPEVQPPSVGV